MVASASAPAQKVLFRLAIEEMEAWLLGDRTALMAAFPRAKQAILNGYQQDSVCGTWEVLANAIHPKGSLALKKSGHATVGTAKHDWARAIAPHMDVERNESPSFGKLRDGLRRVVASRPPSC